MFGDFVMVVVVYVQVEYICVGFVQSFDGFVGV